MRQKRRSVKMKMAWNQLQLKELSAPAGCSLWPIWIPSGKCPMERDGPGTEWEYESSFLDGDGGPVCTRENLNGTWRPWSLQDLVLRRHQYTYWISALVYRTIYLLLYFPCTFGGVNGKRIISASWVLAYFLIYWFYCYWQMFRWHCSDFPTIPVWLLSHKWGQAMQLQHLSCGS